MRWKWLWGTVAVAALLVFLTLKMYETIFAEEWNEQDAAVQLAYEKTVLVKATKAEPFVGDKPYTIVYGEDKLGQNMIVWVGEQDIHTEYVKDGVPKEQILQQWQAADASKQLLRMTPAIQNDRYGWEIFYKRLEDGKEKYYYDYYDFTDGSLIDTFNLTLR